MVKQVFALSVKQDCLSCAVPTFFQVMGAYGYSIEQTLIVDIEPDVTVRRAMNEINAG